MLAQKSISKLYRGVSTQDETNQLEGQVRQSVNMLHNVERGVGRRNPTELVKELTFLDTQSRDVFIHNYSRGDNIEKYIMLFMNGGLRVFNTEGEEKVVNYLNGANSALNVIGSVHSNFRCLTVGDTTFVVNTSKVVAMSDTIDGIKDAHLNNPFYWVSRSFDNGQGVGYDYQLNGASVNSNKTTTACAKLLTALGSTNYARYGSILIMKNKPSSFTWSDSYGSQASEGFWGVAQKLEDLPNTMSGAEDVYPILIQVQGNPDNKFTKYWLKFTNGHWKETRESGLKNTIDKTTMPFKVVRNELGEFDVDYIDYDAREKGDEFTAPHPSFIGGTISDLFFFKNRLCLISGENVIMSETGAYYNFFPTTVTDILASDPIDVSVDSNSVSKLKHATAFNDAVLLFSDNSQFSLKASAVISPTDISITNTTNYTMDTNIKPISIGNSVFYMSNDLKGTALREYYLDSNGISNTALDVSRHVDGYIPKNINKVIGSTNKDIIMITSSDEPSTVYVYKFYSNGTERVQTAWSKWVLTGEILDMFLMDEYIYFLKKDARVSNKWSLERMDYSTNSNITSFMDAYNTPYTSFVELAEVILQDNNSKIIVNARSPLMYRTIQIISTKNSKYQIRIKNKIRERVAKNVSVQDNKILVQGKSNEIDLFIESVDGEPLEFHTYTVELNYNGRAKLI